MSLDNLDPSVPEENPSAGYPSSPSRRKGHLLTPLAKQQRPLLETCQQDRTLQR